MGAKTRRFSGTIASPRAIRCAVGRRVISSPPKRTTPFRGETIPRIVFSVVDLPDALPPSRQTSSPSPTARFTPWRMWIWP